MTTRATDQTHVCELLLAAKNTRSRDRTCSQHRVGQKLLHFPSSRLGNGAVLRQLTADPSYPVEGGSANDYDYCSADPINCSDLNGEWGWHHFWRTVFVVAAVVVVAMAVVLAAPEIAVAVAGAGAVGAVSGAAPAIGAAAAGTGAYASLMAGRDGAGASARHGDGGRALERAAGVIAGYEKQLQKSGLSKRQKTSIKNSIKNVRQAAEKAAKGTEHHN